MACHRLKNEVKANSRWVSCWEFAQQTVMAVFDLPSQRLSPRKLIPVNVKTLGDQLHLVRIKANLSQSEVAQKLMVSIRTVRKWEHGHACSTEQHWQVLALLFDLDWGVGNSTNRKTSGSPNCSTRIAFINGLYLHAFAHGGTQNFHRMQSGASSAVVDLVAAACAWRGDENIVCQFSHGGKQDEFTDFHRDFVVFHFVAETAGHAATAGGYHFHRIIVRQTEHPRRRLDGCQCFLMAMTVQLNFLGFVGEQAGIDSSAFGFAGDEFIHHQTMRCERTGGGA